MNAFRFIVLLLITFSFLPGLEGQTWSGRPKITDRIEWIDGGGWAYLPFAPGGNATVVRNGQKVVIAPPPGAGNGWSISNGSIFALSSVFDGQLERLWLYRKGLEDTSRPWEQFAEMDVLSGIPLVLFPLKGEDSYLALNWAEGFVEKERASFAAIFRMKNGRLSLDSVVDMPSPFSGMSTKRVALNTPEGSPHVVSEAGSPGPKYACEAMAPGLHPSLWAPAHGGGYVVLASSKTAILWAFSTEDGRCKRVLNLEDLKAEDLPRLGALDHHLLAMQPTDNGTFLIASRTPEVLQDAMEVGRLAGKAATREMLSRWAASPLKIQWIEIDPVTWKVERNAAYRWPLPLAGETFEQLSRFQFIFDQEGRILGNLKGPWSAVLGETGLDGKTGDKTELQRGDPDRIKKAGKDPVPLTLTAAPVRP